MGRPESHSTITGLPIYQPHCIVGFELLQGDAHERVLVASLAPGAKGSGNILCTQPYCRIQGCMLALPDMTQKGCWDTLNGLESKFTSGGRWPQRRMVFHLHTRSNAWYVMCVPLHALRPASQKIPDLPCMSHMMLQQVECMLIMVLVAAGTEGHLAQT